MRFRKFLLSLFICFGLIIPALTHAQSNLFETAISVNGSAISNYEIDQRIRFYEALGVSGDLKAFSEETLINERIYMQAAQKAGVSISNREINEEATAYAAGRNLTLTEFLSRLEEFDVNKETFFEFVEAGLSWRQIVRNRFSARAQDINLNEVDERLELEFKQTSRSVNLREIGIPIDTANPEQSRLIASEVINAVNSESDFDQIARSYSIINSSAQGGAIGWINYNDLNEAVLSLVDATPPGRVTETLELNNVIYVFFVVDKQAETSTVEPIVTEFVTLQLGAANSNLVESIIQQSNSCFEFEQAASVLPQENFQKLAVPSEQSLGEFAAIINALDTNEITQTVSNDGVPTLIMLCKRVFTPDIDSRVSVLNSIQQQRLDLLASSYLENLKASAIVIRN